MTTSGVWRVLSASGPGRFDGIGDFAASLTGALTAYGPAELFVREQSWAELEQLDVVATAGAVVQYFPQAFMRGDLRVMLRWLDRLHRAGKPVVLTVHEYWPPLNGTLRRAVARVLYRRTLRACIRRSTAVVTSQEHSAHDIASVARGHQVVTIPIGSAIPVEPGGALATGRGLVLFGQPAAMHAPTMAAVGAWLTSAPPDVSLTWVGRSADEMRDQWCAAWALPATRVTFRGGLSAAEVSLALQSARVALAPYENGASTRRSTFAALLEHQRPMVALDGVTTSDWLRESGACVWTPEGEPARFVAALSQLIADPAQQAALSQRAGDVFRTHLSWPTIGEAYARVLAQGVTR